MHVQGFGGSRWLGWFSYIEILVFFFFFFNCGRFDWVFFFVLITDHFWYLRICNTIDGIKRETKRREREKRERGDHTYSCNVLITKMLFGCSSCYTQNTQYV